MIIKQEHLEELAKHLKHLRQVSNLTQEELAERTGVTRQVITSIENGKKLPSKSLFLAIVGLFVFLAITSPILKAVLDTTNLGSVLKNLWGNKK